MVRIPEYRKRIIQEPQVIDTGKAQVVSSVASALQQAVNIGVEFKKARDTTKVNELSNQYQLESFDEFEKFKEERLDNPDNFSNDFENLMKKKKETYLKESGLGGTARQTLSRIIDNSNFKFKVGAVKTEREMQVNSFGESMDKIASMNEELSYRAGKNFDFNIMSEIDNSINANIVAGRTFMNPAKLREMKTTQIVNSYSNFVKGIASQDPLQAIKLLDENKLLQSKLSLEERDKLKTYSLNVKKTQEELELDPESDDKTMSKASIRVNEEIRMKSELDKFDIRTKDGKTEINNNEYNSIKDLMEYREDLRQTRRNGNISKKMYVDGLSKTNPAMIYMLNKDKTKYERWFSTSVSEQVVKDINKNTKYEIGKQNSISESEYVGIYEDTINDVIKEGIDPKSSSSEDKKVASDFFKKNLERTIQLRTKNINANRVLSDGVILPLNSEAKQSEGIRLENGWDELITLKDGKTYRVRWKRTTKGIILKGEEPEKFEEVEQ